MRTRELWTRLLLYPGHTLPTAAAPVLVAVGLAIHDGVFAPLPALLAFLGSWLIHVAGVFMDNHELLRRHPAVAEHPELLAAVADRRLALSTLRWAIVGCIAASIGVGAYLLSIGGFAAVAIGLLGLAASLGYAGGPLPYASRGWADLLFLLMFGVVAVVGAYYVQAVSLVAAPGPWTTRWIPLEATVYWIGLPAGGLVTCVLIVDDVRDRQWDRLKGWRTGAVRWGIGWSRVEFTLLVVLAYAAPFACWALSGFTAWVLLPLATLPAAWAAVRAFRTHDSTAGLLEWTPRVALLSLAYSALLALGLSVR